MDYVVTVTSADIPAARTQAQNLANNTGQLMIGAYAVQSVEDKSQQPCTCANVACGTCDDQLPAATDTTSPSPQPVSGAAATAGSTPAPAPATNDDDDSTTMIITAGVVVVGVAFAAIGVFLIMQKRGAKQVDHTQHAREKEMHQPPASTPRPRSVTAGLTQTRSQVDLIEPHITQHVQEAFARYDIDNSGTISKEEALSMVQNMGLNVSRGYIDGVWGVYDA
eukprot:COSAG01_NODE_11813_length_1853_cov_80.211517_3_plen_222_part_01